MRVRGYESLRGAVRGKLVITAVLDHPRTLLLSHVRSCGDFRRLLRIEQSVVIGVELVK
jgi:hypothetical protein